jgi:hypothetical protein
MGLCFVPKPYVIFHEKLIFYGKELLALHPTPQLEYHPLICPQLLIQYSQSYFSYLDVSSICNLRMRHDMEYTLHTWS